MSVTRPKKRYPQGSVTKGPLEFEVRLRFKISFPANPAGRDVDSQATHGAISHVQA